VSEFPQLALMAMCLAAPDRQGIPVGLFLGNATTPEKGTGIGMKADVTVAPDHALLAAQGTTGTMATIPGIIVTIGTTEEIETTGTTGTVEDIEITIEATLVNVALAEAEVPGASGMLLPKFAYA